MVHNPFIPLLMHYTIQFESVNSPHFRPFITAVLLSAGIFASQFKLHYLHEQCHHSNGQCKSIAAAATVAMYVLTFHNQKLSHQRAFEHRDIIGMT